MKQWIAAFMALFSFLHTGLAPVNTTTITYTPVSYTETTAYLDNPYIGYYHIYGYVLKDEPAYASTADVPNIPNPDNTQTVERLVEIQINLCRFREQPLTELALSQLDTILAAWSNTDYSLLLRFLYDWDGNALSAEPSDLSLILTHIEQAAGVFNKYASHIFTLQGLFTGNNGEMHHTNYSSSENLQTLAQKLAEVTDPSIYLAVRTPYQWRSITGSDSYEAFLTQKDSPFLHRLGLFNDGMLGSWNDTGTYMDRSREEELAFQEQLCQTVPNGGEVIIDNVFNDAENAIADMQKMHVTYLNSVHDAAVLNKWKETVYTRKDAFAGVSCYDYIRNHLGYRYVLRSSFFTKEAASTGSSRETVFHLSIENVGFANSYRPFSFVLSLVNTETDEIFSLPLAEDSSLLTSGSITTLSVPLSAFSDSALANPEPVLSEEPSALSETETTLSQESSALSEAETTLSQEPSALSETEAAQTLPEGTYEIYFLTTDPCTGEAISYGNALTLSDKGYLLGTLSLQNTQQ